MADPSVTVTIAGNDVSSDFISLATEQDICKLAQTCTITMRRQEYDSEQGNLSYYGTYRFRDTGQDFTDYDDDTYTLVVRNSNGVVGWGYMGKISSPNDDIIRVYSESTRTTIGWVEGGQGSGVPTSYFVFKDDYETWDSLVVAINSTNRLTGYIDDVIKTRPPGHYIIQGMDEMKRALDTFLDEETRVEEELDAGYWMDYWLVQVGITTSGSVETGRTIPLTLDDETGWQYVNVSDVLLECLGYAGGGYAIIVDGDGVAQIVRKVISKSQQHTLTPIEFSRSQDDSWCRDRAVVFGTTSGSWDDGTWVPGEITIVSEKPDDPSAYPVSVALSSSYIQSQNAADDLAEDILDFFDEELDVKRCLVEGDEDIWLGDTGSIDETWSGYDGAGLITSIETTVDGAGFRQLVSLDEKCGFVWGWGKIPYAHIAHYDLTNEDLKYVYEDRDGFHATIVDSGAGNWYTWYDEKMGIALDSNDYPHISYFYQPNTSLKHAYWDGATWQTETVDNAAYVGRSSHLVVDSDDCVRIAYYDTTNGNLKYAYQDAGGWNIETVTAGGRHPTIVLNDSQYPHISHDIWDPFHSPNYTVYYSYQDADGWHTETVATNGERSSVALHSDGYARASFRSTTTNNLIYATRSSGSWSTETVDDGTILWTSLALASDGYPHIAYHDDYRDDIMYAYKDVGGWHTETVDRSGVTINTWPSLALDSEDYPHISYYNSGTLYYAYEDSDGWNYKRADGPVGIVYVGLFSAIALEL